MFVQIGGIVLAVAFLAFLVVDQVRRSRQKRARTARLAKTADAYRATGTPPRGEPVTVKGWKDGVRLVGADRPLDTTAAARVQPAVLPVRTPGQRTPKRTQPLFPTSSRPLPPLPPLRKTAGGKHAATFHPDLEPGWTPLGAVSFEPATPTGTPWTAGDGVRDCTPPPQTFSAPADSSPAPASSVDSSPPPSFDCSGGSY